MQCLICNKENEKQICKSCVDNDNVKKIIDRMKLNENIDKEVFSNMVINLTESLDSPLKEYYRIMSDIKKWYCVPKIKREYLIDNANICLESNEISNKEKNIIKALLLDTYYKNHQYEYAETIAVNLKKQDLDDLSLYNLGNYYIHTRRYDLAIELLNKAMIICQNEDIKVSINNRITECEERINGNSKRKQYLPSEQENRIIYSEFMKSIGIEIELPKEKPKAPGDIDINDYPIPIELTKAGFKTFVAFDIESTGVNHNIDSITELAAIRVVDGKIVESKEFIFQELVHPYRRKIPKNVEEITGITNEMVSDAREIWEVFKDFAEFIKDDILVGYNCITFDSKFLVKAGCLSNIKIENKYFDVMNYVNKLKYKLNYDSKTLTNIGELLGIKNPNAHRALADSITTAKVYLKLLEMDDNIW